MIKITDKKDCCGCSACTQRCPKHCISMVVDDEGFLYPKVDESECVSCGLCEKVCPVLNQGESHEPLAVYAAKNPDDKVRMASSSGGIFTMLAERTVERGGVVFGACWNDDWEVVHDYTETKDGITKFRGSKYVQSRIGDCFKKAEEFLKSGREVLFSGTPCQIAGLTRFLRKEYENLLKVEVACHGVPSPKVWHNYLEEIKRQKKIKSILSINFRNKKYGWNSYHFSLDYINKENICSHLLIPHSDNMFYRGFLNNLYMRPSCYKCPAKEGRSEADVTIADFWGIDRLKPSLDDNRGYSIVCVDTTRGKNKILELIDGSTEVLYKDIIKYNPALIKSLAENNAAHEFWSSKDGVCRTVENICGDSLTLKIKKWISKILHKLQEYE